MRVGLGMILLGAALIALSATAQTPTAPSGTDSAQPPAEPPGAPPPAAASPAPPSPTPPSPTPPSVTVLGSQEVQGILGREIRSTADENMGRIVDVLVDGEGRTRAAIIDFGGFLGVGSRKIAIDWKALHFVPAAGKKYGIVLELTRDQVKTAPEVKDGKPTIVLGASGNLESLP
ncbi:MAG: PRC-barrel domain-containing protein [Rhodospirillales bacterium]|nr:PRC-barrel domain-containing protein [Rhodospirillales bacterium]